MSEDLTGHFKTVAANPPRLRLEWHGHNGDGTYLRVFGRPGCSVGSNEWVPGAWHPVILVMNGFVATV